jgi:hypothetical protein
MTSVLLDAPERVRERVLGKGLPMKFCYVDESGTGDEPIAVMAGIVADTDRMHVAKADWPSLLSLLSRKTGRAVTELHMRDLYNGRGPYHNKVEGAERAEIIDSVFEWLEERRHHVVYTSAVCADYREANARGDIPSELNTVWRFIGFHLMLAMQRRFMREPNRKGNTVFVFDHEKFEEARFSDLILRPGEWSDEYYDRKRKTEPLDQVVDVPYFAESHEVSLIQVADAMAFILRRYAEVQSGDRERYAGEGKRLEGWATAIAARSIGRAHIYPRTQRREAHDLFFNLAPESLRAL